MALRVAGVLAAVLAVDAVAHLVRIPLPRPESSVVSWGSLHGFWPNQNVVAYVLSVGVASAVCVLVWRRLPAAGGASVASAPAVRRGGGLAALLFATAVLNASFLDPAAPLKDFFHEGEFLAFRPAVERAQAPLEAAFVVHGPGMDVLPAVAAAKILPGSVIAGTRVVRAGFNALFWGAFLWVVWRVIARRGVGLDGRLAVVAVLAVGLAATGFTWEASRKAVLLLQAALALTVIGGNSAAVALALGVSLPVGMLYNYGEGAGGVVLAGVAVLLVALRDRRRGLRAALFCGCGAACAGLAAAALLGRAQLEAIAEQIGYWVANARLIQALPLAKADELALIFLFGPIVVCHAAAALRLFQARREPGGLRGLAIERPELFLVLALSLVGARGWLDRADDVHLAISAWATLPLALALCPPPRLRLPRDTRWVRAAAAAAIAVAVVPVGPTAALSPVRAAWVLFRTASGARVPDERIVPPDYLKTAAAMRSRMSGSDCFWTLTSEGVWYHLLDAPSCSRFHHAFYARTAEAQDEVVRALELRRPPVVLLSNDFWSNHIDKVPVTVTNARIHAYLLSAYRPLERVGDHAIWERADSAPSLGAAATNR